MTESSSEKIQKCRKMSNQTYDWLCSVAGYYLEWGEAARFYDKNRSMVDKEIRNE